MAPLFEDIARATFFWKQTMICTHCNRFKVHSFYTQNYCSKQCYLAATRNPENDFRSHWTLAAKDNIVRRGNNL